MRSHHLGLLVCLALMWAGRGVPAAEPDTAAGEGLDASNVVWTSPSEGSSGSMPLGNGDVGLNLWVEPSGQLVFYLSKTDAWDAHVRLLKLGRVRVKLSPNPLVEGAPLRQELRLRQGEIVVTMGKPEEAVRLRVWVDAHRPVVHIEAEGRKPFAIQTDLELWRTKEGPLEGKQRDAARGLLGAPYPLVVPADTVVQGQGDAVIWYHRNVTSGWPITMKVQGLETLVRPSDDPLLHRTFGGAIRGENLVKAGPQALQSKQPARQHLVSIYALTKVPATETQWLDALKEIIVGDVDTGLEKARREHLAWWNAFWNRSWIRVSGTAAGPQMTTNDLPLRIGAGSDGGSKFFGLIGRAMVFGRALSPEEVAALAQRKDDKLAGDAALLGDWRFDNLKDGTFANAAGEDLPAKVAGQVEVVDAPGGKAIRLAGKGWVEVADCPKLRLARACTLAAWVAQDESGSIDGRILDKSKAATADAYCLDTYPKNSLRMIAQPSTLIHKGCLAAGRWTHVAATFDASGKQCLYVDGKLVADRSIGGTTNSITQGYALQRLVNACGGRGAMPVKFNGSIFTVDAMQSDGDYRRWGSCYWWQNTRFPYWPMLACGDYDLMQPLFDMYLRALPLSKGTTKLYYDHEGAFFGETIYFWGTPCNDDFGWNRGGNPQSLMINQYIRRVWQGGLELAQMMLDRYDHTRDRDFAGRCAVPLADAVVTFYDRHYPREKDGTLRIEPAQACETWWKAVNPMPEVAGLRAVLPRLLALPVDLTTPEQRAAWKRLLGQLPPVPLGQLDDRPVLAAASEFSSRHNCENPELYAIFPYRLYGVGRDDLEMARRSFDARLVKGSQGWQQDPVQSAMLGLADQAAPLVVARFATKDPGSRFPAFWGPNFDWTPDQCHGGNAMLGLQAMVLQPVGRKLYVLPAWPAGWEHCVVAVPGLTPGAGQREANLTTTCADTQVSAKPTTKELTSPNDRNGQSRHHRKSYCRASHQKGRGKRRRSRARQWRSS